MSARVVRLALRGKSHPTTKWSLLIALLVVVSLGVPKWASAGVPTVQPPTGPSESYSGGVYYFSGPYSFATFIYCTNGLNFNSSYSNGLLGTHSFDFYGAPDGSLLVSIDGGGLLLINSCGDPYATPATSVANYTVSISSPPPPTPTPSPTPSPSPSPSPTPPVPTPTPTPPHRGGGGNSSGGSGSSSGGPQSPATPAPSQAPAVSQATPEPIVSNTPLPPKPAKRDHGITRKQAGSYAPRVSLWTMTAILLSVVLLILVLLIIRSKKLRHWVEHKIRRFNVRLEPYWFKTKTVVKRWAKTHRVNL